MAGWPSFQEEVGGYRERVGVSAESGDSRFVEARQGQLENKRW